MNNSIIDLQNSAIKAINNIYTLECDNIKTNLSNIIKDTILFDTYPQIKFENIFEINFYYDYGWIERETIEYSYGLSIKFDEHIASELNFNSYMTDTFDNIDTDYEVEILQELIEEKFSLEIEFEEAEFIYNKLQNIILDNGWTKLSDFSKQHFLHVIM